MNGRPKGRQGDLIARKEWTARLNRFAAAKTTKQRQAAIEAALKINPGGALRDMLQAWGYSASARGRKSKEAAAEENSSPPARERLELALAALFGKTPSPVPSLYAKLAGRVDTTVKDASRIVAALIYEWPEPISLSRGPTAKESRGAACLVAELFIRELLAELSSGRSRDWTAGEMDIRAFRLLDEERIGAGTFVQEAGEAEGALIIAGAKSILIGTHPVDAIRQFHSLTSRFIAEDHKGLLIFVFNAALFEAGKDGFNLLYNIGLLTTAMTAFALFPENYDYEHPIQEHLVDWTAWRALSRRCCVVIRKPPLVAPSTGQFLKQQKFDEFVASWQPEQRFENLGELRGFVRFDSDHILPRTYPPAFGEAVSGKDLYWDVIVRPADREPEGLQVQYFIPPLWQIEATAESQESGTTRVSGIYTVPRGRPAAKAEPIEEDSTYLVRQRSPGLRYDDAHRAMYLAARGRLGLDTKTVHARNLNAAAALRQIGYEVLPISSMLSLFPRALHFAAAYKLAPPKKVTES